MNRYRPDPASIEDPLGPNRRKRPPSWDESPMRGRARSEASHQRHAELIDRLSAMVAELGISPAVERRGLKGPEHPGGVLDELRKWELGSSALHDTIGLPAVVYRDPTFKLNVEP